MSDVGVPVVITPLMTPYPEGSPRAVLGPPHAGSDCDKFDTWPNIGTLTLIVL